MPPTTIVASPLDTKRAAWKAAWLDYYRTNTIRTREAYVLELINGVYAQNPNANPDAVLRGVAEFRATYDRKVMQGKTPLYDSLESMQRNVWSAYSAIEAFTVGVSVGGEIDVNVGTLAKAVFLHLTESPTVKNALQNWTQAAASQAQWQWYNLYKDKVPQLLDGAALAQGLHRVTLDRANLDTGIPTLVGLETAPPNTVLGPALAGVRPETARRIAAAVQPDGSFRMEFDELETMITVDHGLQEQMLLMTMKTVEEVNRKQDDIIKWQHDYDERRRQEEARRLASLANQNVLDGFGATLSVVSQLVGLGDPKLGNDIRVAGSSAIEVYSSIEKYCDTMTQFGKAAELGTQVSGLAKGMAGVVLTGNIVGAVMNIVSLFRDTGPTPEQIILDQVNRLGTQVADLSERMQERFDRVEEGLEAICGGINSIFELVNQRFDQISTDVAAVQRDADDIQRELATQYLLLDRIGQSIHKGLQDGFRHDFQVAFNASLGYAQRNGVDMELAQFNDWETEFYTWAVDEAQNDNEQPLTGRSYDDDSLLLELESYPVEENIAYLSNWLEARMGLPPLTTERVANPVTWSASAWAYTQLLLENPLYAATGTYPARKAAVDRQGEHLAAALRRITLTEDEETHTTRPNHELFEWLVSNYADKVQETDEALRIVEDRARTTTFKVNPWGGTGQSIAHAPAFPAEAPSTIVSFIPAAYLVADYLALDDPALTVRFAGQWTGPWRTEKLRGRNVAFVNRYGRLRAVVAVDYHGEQILSRHALSDELLVETYQIDLRTGEEIRGSRETTSADAALTENWDAGQGLKARFDTNSVETSTPTGTAGIEGRVATRLRELRASVYRTMLQELADGQSLVPTTRRLEGAKALVDRWVGLGLPVALSADDFLRALLFGSQSLVDARQLHDAYVTAFRDALPDGTDELGAVNPRRSLHDEAIERAGALGAHLRGYLDAIGKEEHVEDHAIVSTVLMKSAVVPVIVKAFTDASTEAELPVGSIRINRGAEFTRRAAVTLTIAASGAAPTHVTAMRFRDDTTSWTPWEPYATRKRWMLTADNGAKTVHAQFRDDAGHASPTATATIFLDTVAPAIMSVAPLPRSTTHDLRPTIHAIVEDDRTELSAERIALDLDGETIASFSYEPATNSLDYTPDHALPLGTHSIRLRATDRAGNVRRKRWSFTTV